MKRILFTVFFVFLFLFSVTSCHNAENINTSDKDTKTESDTSIETTENTLAPNTSSEESSVYTLPDEVETDEIDEEEYDEDLYYGEEKIQDFSDEEDKDSDNEENDDFDNNDNIEDDISNNTSNESEDTFTNLNENH